MTSEMTNNRINIVKQVEQNSEVYICDEINEIIQNAQDYGTSMEILYDEPNEYSTSLYESVSMSICSLAEEVKKIKTNHVKKVFLPMTLKELLDNHGNCECLSGAIKKLKNQFKQAKFIYTDDIFLEK